MLNGVSLTEHVLLRSRTALLAAVLALTALAAPSTAYAAPTKQAPVSKATVVEVQALFGELGYPIADEHAGVLDSGTKGALSYFQHKYNLPETGQPDAPTLIMMKAVAAQLKGEKHHSAPYKAPQDLVERTLGKNPPVLQFAIALTGLLALLAFASGRRFSYDSKDETMPPASRGN
ncbi:MAG TPA: peptidoglycan-binding domain-containing protein [Solirubrobacteraceae bacterium]|jgi:hypothetical protein|nr:peptidoglycan-binding domain-containing protein [Solirubrobacteraceae bacterium]